MVSRAIPGTSGARFSTAPRPPRLGNYGTAPKRIQLRTLKGRFARGPLGVSWVGLRDVEELFNRVANLPARTEQMMQQIGEKAIDYAKQHARWADDTGQARGTGAANTDPAHLHYGLVPESNGTVSLYLSHGPGYGTYLEANPETAILAEALLHASNLSQQVAEDEIQRYLGVWAR